MLWVERTTNARRSRLVLIALLILVPWSVVAGVPGLMNYQGYLADVAGQPVPDGDYQMNFRIYPYPTGGTALWGSGAQTVTVTNGSFSYMLGSHVSLPDHLFETGITRYLGISVGSDPEITPRTQLVTVPYAFQSLNADSVTDGAITDASVSATADIDPTKIEGTAMVLSSGWQTVSGFLEFEGPNVYMHDSSFQSSQYGITLGSRAAHSSSDALLEVKRNYNTTTNRDGAGIDINNSSSGSLFGLRSEVEHTTAGVGGSAVAVNGYAISDGSVRAGFSGIAQAKNSSITTGTSYGVSGAAYDGASAYGIYGYASSATTNYAGYFNGNVQATGVVIKAGGTFRIDHPLDPENKYLQHSFVESPDMMNIYNGNVTLDARGEAEIKLPEWFEKLNMDFRYQLTAIGAPGPDLYIATEIRANRFRIAGGSPGMKVSWQVTGVRRDPWAEANRIEVEIEKNDNERGQYLHPEVYNQPIERSVDYESLRPILEQHEESR